MGTHQAGGGGRELVVPELIDGGIYFEMSRVVLAVGITGFLISGCAFDLANVTYTPTAFERSHDSPRGFTLSKDVDLEDTPCNYSRTLRKATRYEHIGKIPEGNVFRSKGQALTVECSNVHEAYLVISEDSFVGFFLPVEQGFVPHSPPLILPITQ